MRLPIQIEAILSKRTDGEIRYLILKTTPEREGFWQPVTGGLEKGETRLEALEREVSEETGIKNITKIIKGVHYYEPVDLPLIKYLNEHGYSCKHLQQYVYGAKVSSEEKVVLDGKEHSECRWCSFEEALKLMKYKGNKEALKKLNKILSVQKRHILRSFQFL